MNQMINLKIEMCAKCYNILETKTGIWRKENVKARPEKAK